MLVLGLETSCDETGVALYDSQRGLLAHALFSQIDLHRIYGGVVPELASRDHIKRMLPLIEQVLDEAQCQANDIQGIAYTAGPGLNHYLCFLILVIMYFDYHVDTKYITLHKQIIF